MAAQEFLTNVGLVLALMALAALLELAVPLVAHPPAPPGRRAINLGLTAMTFAGNWVTTSVAVVTALASPRHLLAGLDVPAVVQLGAGVVVLDFFYGYLAHRTMHHSSLLWRVHRLHHRDPFVDVTTTYRTHPVEVAWRSLFLIVPVWLLGVSAEAVLLHRVLAAVTAISEHANVRLWQPLDRVLSLVWVTPNMHKVHHSRLGTETNSNYGNLTSVFDRLLRTFTPTERAFGVVYGLDEEG